MKTKNILSLVLFAAMAWGLQGCSDSDNSMAATGLDVTKDNVSVSALDFNISASSAILGVSTDGDWTAAVPDADTTWLKITPHAGYGWNYKDSTASNTNAYIKVTVATNKAAVRTSTITVKAGSQSKTITVKQKGTGVDPNDPFESAWNMIANLKVGYNLGNTLDSNPEGSWWDPTGKTPKDYETSWGQPYTTQEMIDSIAAKGFNIIRVPVTWGPHLDSNNKIDEAWMTRVEEVVNYVLKAGCYCVINVMHDTGEKGWLYADMGDYATQTVKYQAIWKQIAERFKSYGDKLIFESFNEILNKQRSWTAPAAADGAYQAINKLQQDFVNTVRATGGNNEYRNLAITTYAATGNNTVPLAEVTVPTDVHSGHIYLTLHTYDPYNFCSNNGDYNILVWDASCEAEVSKVVDQVANRANELGVPYIFGEFGAIDDKKAMNERVKYADYVAAQFKAHNTTGLWWMGLFDRTTLTWTEPLLVNALMKGLSK